MNPLERGVHRVDAWQQRHRVPAFVFGVIKKFGDDQAGYLVALLSYYAFLSTFPLLLALTEILGLVLAGHPTLAHRIQTSALSEFPIIGTQLRSQVSGSALPHSGLGLVIGLGGSVLGGRGLANAVQNTLNSVWSVPRVDRPGFPWNWLRTFGLLGLLFVGAVLTAVATWAAGASRVLGVQGLPRLLALGLSTLLDVGLFWAAFRLATARMVASRDLLPGAVLSGVAWQVLLSAAGLFGLVLGLLAWLGLQATVTVYALEADVVRARRLWPRSLTQPPLTRADKRYLTDTTDAERRRPEQEVQVGFTPSADRDPNREAPRNDH